MGPENEVAHADHADIWSSSQKMPNSPADVCECLDAWNNCFSVRRAVVSAEFLPAVVSKYHLSPSQISP